MFSAAKASERGEARAQANHRNRKWEAKDFEKVYHLSYGSAFLLTSCSNILDVPTITWITPSPHFAAKDVSDVLEVKIENDKTLVRVNWYHNGTLIERTTEGFAFPGKTVIDIRYEKTAYISQRLQRFPRETTSEKRAQKFHTDDASLPRSG